MWNHTLNSDAAPNYKYVFGVRTALYLICEKSHLAHIILNMMTTKQQQMVQWRSVARAKENHK